MSRLKDFAAFRALLFLLKENGMEHLLQETYVKSKMALENGTAYETNFLQSVYENFTDEEISEAIAKIVTPKNLKAEVKVVYQSVDNLHKACPRHAGDWYFTGNYPTPGGNIVVNRAFVNYCEGNTGRAY
jgi:amidophosphoribosyltransferase